LIATWIGSPLRVTRRVCGNAGAFGRTVKCSRGGKTVGSKTGKRQRAWHVPQRSPQILFVRSSVTPCRFIHLAVIFCPVLNTHHPWQQRDTQAPGQRGVLGIGGSCTPLRHDSGTPAGPSKATIQRIRVKQQHTGQVRKHRVKPHVEKEKEQTRKRANKSPHGTYTCRKRPPCSKTHNPTGHTTQLAR